MWYKLAPQLYVNLNKFDEIVVRPSKCIDGDWDVVGLKDPVDPNNVEQSKESILHGFPTQREAYDWTNNLLRKNTV